MEKIFSNVDPSILLHIIVRKTDLKSGRQDVIDPDQFIQCSILGMDSGKTFKPHKHIWKERIRNVIAQESWIVIQGRVKCIFYDLDDTILAERVISQGDASFTLQGGHNYEVLDDNTLVYEYKTGPYEGQTLDKVFIDE